MKTIAILALVGIAATAFFAFSSSTDSAVEAQFQDFLSTHRVGYGTNGEYNFRLGVFQENLNTIDQLNAANPEATFAVNMFADRTPEEMSRLMTLNVPAHKLNTNAKYVAPRGDAADADYTDMWSAVKNQGQCGSCWAFSATACFEARYALHQKQTTVQSLFSEQQLVDCDTKSYGCNGGWMDFAFTYLETHQFCTESEYPYTGTDGTCDDTKCSAGPTDTSFTDIPAKDEDALLTALVNGPVSVAVDASTWSFYSSGVMSSCGTGINHGVTLVADSHSEGWARIRNSWGGSWGESGTIRIKLGQDTCGYADVASFPVF